MWLLNTLNGIDLGELKVTFNFKATFSMENLDWFLEGPYRLWGHFFFFDNLMSQVHSTNKNKNVRLHLAALPTIAVPGFYTSEEGKKFATFMRIVKEIEKENTAKNIFRCIKGSLDVYEQRFQRLLEYVKEYNSNPSMFTCSAGDSNFQLDCDGNVHLCHRTLFYDSPEYVQALMESEYQQGRENKLSKGYIDNMRKNWIIPHSDQKEIDRFLYISGNYHNFAFPRAHLAIPTVLELASSGQISKLFLDKKWAEWLALFCGSLS